MKTYLLTAIEIALMVGLYAKWDQKKLKNQIEQGSLQVQFYQLSLGCQNRCSRDIVGEKILNSIIYTKGARFSLFDTKNFYLGMPMKRK